MKITHSKISGLIIIEPKVYSDSRGYFFESYANEKFKNEISQINFIQDNIKPKMVIHLEPIAELLPQNNLLSYLSTKYFQKRNYLNGYLAFLRKQEKSGKIKIHLTSRMPFGSLYIEGYSLIVWSPCF